MQVPPPVQMEPSSAPASPERGGQGKAGGKSKGGKKGGGRNQGNNRGAEGGKGRKRNQDGGGKGGGGGNAPPAAPAVNVPGQMGMMPYPMMMPMPGVAMPGMPGMPMMVPPAMMMGGGAVPQNFPAMIAMGAMMQQNQQLMSQMSQMGMAGMGPMGMPMEGDVDEQRRMQRDTVQQQVEYYFSAENLAKDLYLRQQMEKEGWVSIHVIAGFNRLRKMLTPPMAHQLGAAAGAAADIPLLVEALQAAPDLELDPTCSMVRRRNGWEQYVLPQVKAGENAATAAPGNAAAEKPSASETPAA
jgi:la-related protein 1